MHLDRRQLFMGAAAVAGNSLIPLRDASARWESPIVREGEHILSAQYNEFHKIGANLYKIGADDPGAMISSARDAEEKFFALYGRYDGWSDYQLNNGSVLLVSCANRVAYRTRRGPGESVFAHARTWERLGLKRMPSPPIGRWSTYSMDVHPMLIFYGTDDFTLLGEDTISVYVGKASYDAGAVISGSGDRRRLVLNRNWNGYAIRSQAPLALRSFLSVAA